MIVTSEMRKIYSKKVGIDGDTSLEMITNYFKNLENEHKKSSKHSTERIVY